MSIRDQIQALSQPKPRLTVVDKWLQSASFDVNELREEVKSGDYTVTSLLTWAQQYGGYEGGETTFRKWVKECQSETS